MLFDKSDLQITLKKFITRGQTNSCMYLLLHMHRALLSFAVIYYISICDLNLILYFNLFIPKF